MFGDDRCYEALMTDAADIIEENVDFAKILDSINPLEKI